ncbi:MAG: DNRLRE domain-containing protein [Opitutaceae bacterium]|nr:DNRLRE domain-containing protein [Opitutaceae bacterium]
MKLLRSLLSCAALLLALSPFVHAQESVHTIRRGFVSPITPEMKAHLRAIKLRGDALGRAPGILGQWGDSISNSNAYLGALCSWSLISSQPADGHDYLPTLLWMGATRNSADNPLHNFKGGSYCCESGWRVPNALAAVDDAIARANPSWSLTMYGTNDIHQSGWSPATYDAQLERFIQINIDAGIVPILSTIPPCTGYDTRVAEANTVVRAVAARMRIPLVDLHGVFMALHPNDWATVLLGDGVHPSYLGGEGQLLETAHNAAGLFYQRDSGYNIRSMLTVDMAEKLRAIVFDNAAPDGANLPLLVVSSPTHPYKTLTTGLSPTFTFTHDSGPAPTAYSWTIDQSPWTEPDTTAEGTTAATSASLAAPGTWYCHVRANSAAGWGPAAHYCVRAADAPTVELRHESGATSPHRDTFISAHWGGNDNFGASATLNVYNDGSPARSRGLFFFDLSGVSTTGLESATLVLNIDGAQTSATTWDLFPITSAWTEGTGNGNDNASGVTWATAPTYGATALATGSLAAGATAIEADITASVQGWLTNPAGNFGVMFQHRALYRSLYLIAREYGATDLRPTLRLRYASTIDIVPPTAPGNFTAALVGTDSASLSWSAATDNVGVTTYRIYRNGTLRTSTAALTFTDAALPVASSFSYTVAAVDAAGNEGPATAAAVVTTPTPTLYAGADRTITVQGGTCLEATFSGLTLSTPLAWSQVSGPADARIVNPTNPHTAVYFETGGDYTFRCTVTSGGTTYTDDVLVTVDDFPIRRRTVAVSTVAELRAACSGARANDLIQLTDGLYDLTTVRNSAGGTWITLAGVSGVTLCSASGNPAAVTLRGNGFADRSDNADGLWINTSSLVTIRGLTFEGFGAYAIKLEASVAPVPSDIRIENCRFLETGMRCIKGTITPTGTHVHRGWVKGCRFENTALPPETSYSGDYIAAIDMMGLCNWEFADNEFDGVRGLTGGGRAAIFLWHETRGALIERNFIYGCDRGIAFGNPSGTAAVHAAWSLARNNVIIMDRSDGITPDEPIELAQVEHVRIAHNTAWRVAASARGLRCSAFARDTEIANNIVRGQPTLDTGVTAHHNLFGDVPSALFADDFHLVATAATAIGQGAVLASVTADFDLIPRDAAPDLGAFEYVTPLVYATWRAANFFGPDLTNDAISGPLSDPDGCGLNNFARYAFALLARGRVTNPVVLGTADTAAGRVLTLTFPRRTAAPGLTYTLESSTDLITWTAVEGRTYTAGPDSITAQDAVALGSTPCRFLRVRITASP